MASSKTEYKPRNLKVFFLDDLEPLLRGVKVAACMLTESAQLVVDEKSVLNRVNALTISGRGACGERAEQCSCCGVPFESRAQQIAHYKHHWHAYNLKRRLFGKPALTLANFTNRQDDNSSVSGSDSEEDAGGSGSNVASDLFAAATRHCKAFFTNARGEVFCLYRCILHHRKETLSTDGEGWAWVERCQLLTLPGRQRWAVIMVSGGHFAAAIFAGGSPVLHKTLHSYVVRRGQGQAQGARDQHGNAPKSSGASLRRYNQAQFALHVQEILAGWTQDLAGCSLVLYRAVGPLNQAVLFGKASPLMKDDVRLRAFPFPTRKPTFKEVQRAHATVANVEVYDTMELFQKALIASSIPAATKASDSDRSRKSKSTAAKPIDRAKSREPIARELPTEVMSSEDEGPCYIDSETPAGWIKTLSEQSSNGVITNSRKDLLNDNVRAPVSSESEPEEAKGDAQTQQQKKKKKKKPKVDEAKTKQPNAVKIPDRVKNLWKAIKSREVGQLETVVEAWEAAELAAAVNTADPHDGNTALHKAAIAASPDMVTRMLAAGGDPCARNHALQTPYVAGEHRDTRLAFRMFHYPDTFNYAKAHIPGPLTAELLEAETERRAAQRRAKRARDKDKLLEKLNTGKFLELTDKEKTKKMEPRCFLCGARLPKASFEYEAYKFCSIRCLQNHRNVRPLHLPA